MRPRLCGLMRAGILAAAAGSAACQPVEGPLAEAERPPVLEPRPGQSYFDLGVILLATREHREAERAFTRSLSAEGMSPQTLTGLGIAAANQGHLGRAQGILENARELAPEDPVILNNLGLVLYGLGEYHAAKQAFHAAFLISSGQDRLAEANLAKTEQAIALTSPGIDYNPAVSHTVQRIGASEYRLLEVSDPPPGGTDSGPPEEDPASREDRQ